MLVSTLTICSVLGETDWVRQGGVRQGTVLRLAARDRGRFCGLRRDGETGDGSVSYVV